VDPALNSPAQTAVLAAPWDHPQQAAKAVRPCSAVDGWPFVFASDRQKMFLFAGARRAGNKEFTGSKSKGIEAGKRVNISG
jgi:hypothetical protein